MPEEHCSVGHEGRRCNHSATSQPCKAGGEAMKAGSITEELLEFKTQEFKSPPDLADENLSPVEQDAKDKTQELKSAAETPPPEEQDASSRLRQVRQVRVPCREGRPGSLILQRTANLPRCGRPGSLILRRRTSLRHLILRRTTGTTVSRPACFMPLCSQFCSFALQAFDRQGECLSANFLLRPLRYLRVSGQSLEARTQGSAHGRRPLHPRVFAAWHVRQRFSKHHRHRDAGNGSH